MTVRVKGRHGIAAHSCLPLILLILFAFLRPSLQVTVVLTTLTPDFSYSNYCDPIEPGVCCRFLMPSFPPSRMWSAPPYAGRSRGYRSTAMFHGMTALDLGVAWTFKRDANSHQDWISGCGGQVFGTPVSGGGPGFKLIRSNQAALALNEVPIRGANFLRFSGSQPQMAAAQGIRAFLAGGGTMFTDGRANPSFGDTSIAASGGASLLNSGDGAASEAEPSADMDVKDLEDVQKASALADRMAGTNSVYPTIVGIDGTNYTQQGGRMSLLYKDEKTNFMIDLATRTPTACLDAWDCEIEQACSHQILRDQLLLYGAQLALGTIGICQSLNS